MARRLLTTLKGTCSRWRWQCRLSWLPRILVFGLLASAGGCSVVALAVCPSPLPCYCIGNQVSYTSTVFLDQELISYSYLSCSSLFVTSCWGDALFKKGLRLRAPSFEIGSGWNFAGLFFASIPIDWGSPIFHTSYFHDGGHDVMMSVHRPLAGI